MIDPSERPAWRTDLGPALGRGGFASVWELDRGHVLKVAHADHDLSRARMKREAEALAGIGAPAVPRLIAHGVTQGRAWIEMEKVTGENVGDLLKAGPVRADRAVLMMMALLEALHAVHAAGFAHRDLKPENLVRRADGTVVILDLGIARKLPDDPDDPTRAGVQIGSLEYLPPEQARDAASADARSDIYAVGCILFELCTGRPPFVGDVAALERAHAALRPPRMSELAAVPAVLEVIVADCLAKDPRKRPTSALELRARLQATRDTPSIARSVPQLSQLTESKQPVVLVWSELPKVDRALLAQFAARKVLVTSQRGRKVLGVLLGSAHADPASTALALAADLVAAGARVACHLDALVVETAGPAPVIKGEAVERVESWVPVNDAWTGMLLTRAFASVAQVATRPSPLGEAFRTLAADAADTELVGRDALLVDLAADAAAALRGQPSLLERSQSGAWTPMGPAFGLLYGDPGVGKSAFATELGRRISELGAHVIVAALPAPGMGNRRGAFDDLVGPISGPPVRAIGDALRAHARGGPLAIILDDLHYADHDLLEALEYATLGGESLPLWILGIADPRLDVRRPKLGTRAERHRRDLLAPLEEEAAVTLATRLLQPAEYPPLRAVRQLVGLAHRNPLHLTMLAREIHERGAIRLRPGSTEYFLDTSALDTLEPIALGPWTASRATSDLAAELVALARMCAVIGGPVVTSELAAVIAAVEEAGGATTLVDPEVGIRELIAAHVLAVSPTGAVFRQPLVEDGLYATTDPDARRAIHVGALATLPYDADPERIARHAEAVGAGIVAASAYAELGTRAEREHKPLEAADAWAGALRHLEERDSARARAIMGRARALMRLQRMDDALALFDEAIAIAGELDDPLLEIEALLEEAIVVDFKLDFERAAALGERARARAAGLDVGPLALDLELARGRDLFRAHDYAGAVACLRGVLERARADRPEIAAIAALLLGPSLSEIGDLDQSKAVFAQLITDCTEQGDRFHLIAAYGNRAWLWLALGEVDRTAEDLRLGAQLARENGQAFYERGMTHNLAEQLLWEGKLTEAIQLARRGLALQRTAGEGGTEVDRLLLARVLAAQGERSELRELLATFIDVPDDPNLEITLAVLRALSEDAGDAVWDAVLLRTEDVFPQLRLELWQLAATVDRLGARTERARELAAGDAIWKRRASAFASP